MTTKVPTFREIVQSYFNLIREADGWSDEVEALTESEFWTEVEEGGHAPDPGSTDFDEVINAIFFKPEQKRPDVHPPCITPRTMRAALWVLRGLKLRFEAGEQEAMMEAVEVCAMFNLPMPGWVRLDFFNRFRRYSTFNAKDLGEAFGITRPKGAWLATEKRKHDLFDRLYMGVQYRREFYGESLGQGRNSLWPVVAKHFGISISTARNYYYKDMTADQKAQFAHQWHDWKQANPLPKDFGKKKSGSK